MWEIEDAEIRVVTLDFGGSGGARFRASQLVSNDTLLINAIELVDWESDEAQFLICEACGTVGCRSGGWVGLRSAGPLVLALPAFNKFMEDKKEYREYAPAYYVRKMGVPYFDCSTYESLRARHSNFPPVDRLRRLTMREAVLTLQMDAPAKVFGTPPDDFAYREELVIGTTGGDVGEEVRRLEEIARTHYEDRNFVSLRRPTENEAAISLFFDFAEFTEWKPMVRSGADYHLMLNSQVVVAAI